MLLSGKSSHIHLELDMSISLLLLANQLTDRGFLWANHVMDGCFAAQAQLVLMFFYNAMYAISWLYIYCIGHPYVSYKTSVTHPQYLGRYLANIRVYNSYRIQLGESSYLSKVVWLTSNEISKAATLSDSSCTCLQCLGLLALTCPGRLSDSSCTWLSSSGLSRAAIR